MKSIICIIETPYRGTQEEQDDAALWFSHAVHDAGSPMALVLRGGAVSYALEDQDPTGVRIGDLTVARPPVPDRDLRDLQDSGVPVHVVRDDAMARGLDLDRLVSEFELIDATRLPDLLAGYDQVWHW